MGKLLLIPLPLAENTVEQVIPAQVKEAVLACDMFLVEEIRTARRYVSSLRLGLTIEDLRFETLDKKTKKEQLLHLFSNPKIKTIGVMSEAGCPGVADPGALAVQIAHEKKWKVEPLVGPSSIILALMGSGLNGQSFTFHGYLPIDRPKRIAQIKVVEGLSAANRQTQIFIETPYRNNHMLEDLIKQCLPTTLLCVASDLTGENAYIKTMPIHAWKKQTVDLHKQPTVFLLLAETIR